MIKLDLKPSNTMLRQFAAGLLVATGIFVAINFAAAAASSALQIVIAATLVLAILGLLKPKTVKYPFLLLSVLTFPIGFVVSYTILSVIYFGMITPLGVAMRIAGRDPLLLKKIKDRRTTWVHRNEITNLEYYLRQ